MSASCRVAAVESPLPVPTLTRVVSDSDSVRRQNRALVLSTLRRSGPLARTNLAAETGLSHASITAITQDMLAQGILAEMRDEPDPARMRGRPAVRVGFSRTAGCVALVELEVNRAQFSLVDYGGTLIDRFELAVAADEFGRTAPAEFLVRHLALFRERNRREMRSLLHIAVSVQGILDRDGRHLRWSPIGHMADRPFADDIAEAFGVPVSLHKRGRLLAEGSRWLDPRLRDASVATVFVGSTVAMGLTFRGDAVGRGNEGATEFGHMNHLPGGALCRCGARGCIEAYAADYAVLRTAYSVPETAPPAASVPASQYEGLIARAEAGDRATRHAFNMAGRAIGYGLSRVISVVDATHVRILGPGARAYHLMRAEIEAALSSSLVGRVAGLPEIVAQVDEKEAVFRGLMMKILLRLDEEHFAFLPNAAATA